MANDLIERMAQRYYEALSGGPPARAWSQLAEPLRDAYYDAMWAALKELREPTDEMLEASWVHTARVKAIARMQAELGRPKDAHLLKMKERWMAAMDKLLEVK